MADDITISLTNVSKVFKRYHHPVDRLKELLLPGKQKAEEFWALQNVSLDVARGETVGIIGRNGSGKSTLLQIIAGTLQPTTGNVSVNGRVAALLELGSGFNPEFTGHQNIFFNGRILGLAQSEIEARYDQIVEFAGIGDFIHQPVKTYSSGMFVRLAFAVQANIDANIVIIDEALAVGDVFFRQKCYSRLEQLRSSGAAIIIVSHAMADIEQHCRRALLLDHGVIKFLGSSSDAAQHYYLSSQSPIQPQTTGLSKKVKSTTLQSDLLQSRKLSHDAFTYVPTVSQVTDHKAHCTRFAVLDSDGKPCNIFRQGDKAVFYYEFEVKEFIEVPICGIVIKNDRGVIVHGKNTWQTYEKVPVDLEPGRKLACEQEIGLDLQPGEYIFELGLASVAQEVWGRRSSISHQETSEKQDLVCYVSDAGFFTVNFKIRNNVEVLTHHGVADLPGKITMQATLSSIYS